MNKRFVCQSIYCQVSDIETWELSGTVARWIDQIRSLTVSIGLAADSSDSPVSSVVCSKLEHFRGRPPCASALSPLMGQKIRSNYGFFFKVSFFLGTDLKPWYNFEYYINIYIYIYTRHLIWDVPHFFSAWCFDLEPNCLFFFFLSFLFLNIYSVSLFLPIC